MFRLRAWSPARRLRAKFVLLALLPLLGALGLMALAVSHQDRELAERERVLVVQTYMNARRAELRHYVDLAVSTVRPLYDSGQTDAATRRQAIQRLASLDYGSDGYFFVYDLDGEVLMHSRQPELLGRNLWDLRDPRGQPTIQQLIAQARNGGGYVEYLWQKPSSGKMVPKLGYVVALPRWHLMLGTGLYLDDMDDTLTQLDQQVRGNISATLWWMLGIAGLWSSWKSPKGEIVYSYTMLTINADTHALMNQFHKPADEKRMVVILEPDRYGDWLNPAMPWENFMVPYAADSLRAVIPEPTQKSLLG